MYYDLGSTEVKTGGPKQRPCLAVTIRLPVALSSSNWFFCSECFFLFKLTNGYFTDS